MMRLRLLLMITILLGTTAMLSACNDDGGEPPAPASEAKWDEAKWDQAVWSD